MIRGLRDDEKIEEEILEASLIRVAIIFQVKFTLNHKR